VSTIMRRSSGYQIKRSVSKQQTKTSKQTKMKKVVQSKEEYFIQFSDEEVAELGIECGDKFTIRANQDGSITLVPWVPVEINLDALTIVQLRKLISQSIQEDVSIGDILRDAISRGLHADDLPQQQDLV